MPQRRKRPRVREEPQTKKIPRMAQPAPDGTPIPLRWSFSRFDDHPEWRTQTGNVCEFYVALTHLRDYERRPVSDFLGHSKRDHAVPIPDLCQEAQTRLLALEVEELDELYRFRFNGAQRLWGMLYESIFYILWWDPEHRVCRSTT